MTATRLILGICILFLLSAPAAWGAELSRIACDPSDALNHQPCRASGAARTKPAEGSGAVNAKAIVISFRGLAVPLKVAVDSAKPDAKAPDILRLDFTGKGRFTDAPTVPLKDISTGGGFFQHIYNIQAKFGPETIQADLPGGKVPVIVRGEYFKADQYRHLLLSVGTALQGRCRFGRRVVAVRIIDGDGDLRLGGTWRALGPRLFGGQVTPGDTLAIDTGDGSFTKGVRKFCYGSPVEIDGAWYDVKLAEDGKKITAEPLKVDLGKIQIDHPKWSCLLVGRKYLLRLSGGPAPVTVPADRYMVTKYEQWGPAGAAGRRAYLSCSDLATGAGASVAVTAGKTAKVTLGSPLTASVSITKRSGDMLSLSLVLLDASGRKVSDLQLPNGKQPAAPKVVVKDADGKPIYTCSLEYG